ncbi:MAG: hypothetical protein PHG95_02455 [Patescibacteria group bacterium]|nr:hypothetical protein [Patescibacteria group bacterium]
MLVQSFSIGKDNNKNEDYFGYNDDCFVVTDGATDKSGREYNSQTGGEIISKIVVDETLACNLNGIELIEYLNNKVAKLYEKFKIVSEISDAKFRFSCYLVAVRIINNKVVITSIGDTSFRINGQNVFSDVKQVDVNNAEQRAKYIEETGDIAGSREYIMPLLIKQFEYQNNSQDPLGYGVIDGTSTPAKFIKTFEYNISDIKTIEIFTDGYFSIPSGTSIEDWEEAYEITEKEDPNKYMRYKSTKSKDDRTVLIIDFTK